MTSSPAPRRRASSRRSRLRHALLGGAVLAVLALPGAVLANHDGFADGPYGVHDPGVHFVSQAGITTGCGDGSRYCPNEPVTRAQMATFMHRLSGNASAAPSVDAATLGGLPPSAFAPAFVPPLETEPNDDPSSASEHPVAGPAYGTVVGGEGDYWRVDHPGGDLVGETFTVKCTDGSFGDTVLTLFDATGAELAFNDDIEVGNVCSLITSSLPAGTYYLRVEGFLGGGVSWYGLNVHPPGAATSGLAASDAAPLDRK